ncbi:hypothetical protein FDP41_010971 [Naegleria fowleri]|uniref:Uncharacterized protein n=1 Tax=Naegleria fowleri TaxID=5763 RepID=A0A6A5BY03_NAEFO|nr:uncharacterized protein FDP41_010971 [Naegleria fowleri]KAF0982993.1 hypothetical protein FDP41_010971 [Naegleria fowleri]CAG4715031.1 unnamed protein product [Naegleria fowleri]
MSLLNPMAKLFANSRHLSISNSSNHLQNDSRTATSKDASDHESTTNKKKTKSLFPFKRIKSCENNLLKRDTPSQADLQQEVSPSSSTRSNNCQLLSQDDLSLNQVSDITIPVAHCCQKEDTMPFHSNVVLSDPLLSGDIPEYNLSQFRFGDCPLKNNNKVDLTPHVGLKNQINKSEDSDECNLLFSDQPLTSHTRVHCPSFSNCKSTNMTSEINYCNLPFCGNPLDRILILGEQVKHGEEEKSSIVRDTGFGVEESDHSMVSSVSSLDDAEISQSSSMEPVLNPKEEEAIPINRYFKSRNRVSKKRHTRKNSSSLKEIDLFSLLSIDGSNIQNQARHPSIINQTDRRVSIVEEYVDL